MVVGFTVNNILRDYISQIEKSYFVLTNKEPIKPINPFDLGKSFPAQTVAVEESEFDITSYDVELEPYEGSDTSFEVMDYIYKEAAFEIFGRCDESTDNVVMNLRKLEKGTRTKFSLLSRESPRSKCATLFFLSKNNFDLSRVEFPVEYKNFWDNVDIIVTDDPNVLRKKPKDKISIKIKNDFNADERSDYTLDSITEFRRLGQIINQIKNKKSTYGKGRRNNKKNRTGNRKSEK